MKHLRRFIAVLLAALLLCTCVTAFATAPTDDPTPAPKKPGVITLTNAQKGKQYNLYKVFDVELVKDSKGDTVTDAAGNAKVRYTIAEKWEGFFAEGAPGAQYLLDSNSATVEQKKTLTPIDVGGNAMYINITAGERVQSFATDALAFLATCDPALAADRTTEEAPDNGELVIEDLDLGYYLVYPLGATEIVDKEGVGSLCSLTTTTPEAEIEIKGKYPFLHKETTDPKINDPHAIGDEIPFKLTSAVPDTTGFSEYTFEIQDRMNKGFAFNSSSVKIYIAGYELPESYRVVVKDNGDTETDTEPDTETKPSYTLELVEDAANTVIGFNLKIYVLELVKDEVKLVGKDESEHTVTVGDGIVVNYSATITEGALEIVAENEAKLVYSNDPSDREKTDKTPPEKVKAYTAVIEINKVDGADKTTPLAGAKFILRKQVGENEYQYYKWVTTDEHNDLPHVDWVEWNGTKYPAADDGVTVVTTTFNDDESKAIAIFNGLAEGTYEIIEIEAPAGYNLLTAPVKIDVEANETPSTPAAVVTESVKVENNSGSDLPTTGGIGTTIFYVVGGLLMVVAFVLLVTKKRMGADK